MVSFSKYIVKIKKLKKNSKIFLKIFTVNMNFKIINADTIFKYIFIVLEVI